MSKPAKQQTATSATSRAGAITTQKPAQLKTKAAGRSTKQSRVIAMLQSPSGVTIETMMKASGWQQHSVRGFLAGVVRKRLKLKLTSEVVGDNRVYRISGAKAGKAKRAGPRA